MDETFMKARAYLAQNYSDPELSLTDLCHYLGFSCSYFSTLFKQKTGLNYSHYITSLRLEQAARLLTDTDDTALSIGYQVGYSAPNYFSRAFKKFYGISPSRYREQNQSSYRVISNGRNSFLNRSQPPAPDMPDNLLFLHSVPCGSRFPYLKMLPHGLCIIPHHIQ